MSAAAVATIRPKVNGSLTPKLSKFSDLPKLTDSNPYYPNTKEFVARQNKLFGFDTALTVEMILMDLRHVCNAQGLDFDAIDFEADCNFDPEEESCTASPCQKKRRR